MSEPAKLYCSASRDLATLRQRTREELREVREARKAAESLLLEMQREGETVARLPNGECFSLRVKCTARRPTQGPEIFEQLQTAWADGAAALCTALREDPSLDPVDFFVRRLFEEAWPSPEQTTKLEVRPAKETASRVQDLPAAPAAALNLVASVAEAARVVGDRSASVREEAKRLRETCRAAEERLIPELAELPEGCIRRIDFRDASGEESFYVRLKLPRTRPKRKFSAPKVERALRSLLAERTSSAVERNEVVARLQRHDFAATLCRDLEEALAQPAEPSGPRVALDRVRGTLA